MSYTNNTPAPMSPAITPEGHAYASFSARLAAFGIDQIILFVITIVFVIPVTILFGLAQMLAWPFVFIIFTPAVMPFTTLIAWCYFAFQESSYRQATIGKRLFGLKVADMQGNRIGFGRATLRFFGKFVSSAIMMVGWVMAAFTEKHQALHDMLADTIVLKKTK